MVARVFQALIGQDDVVATLERAVAAAKKSELGSDSQGAMTHAWLFTGPPGSGRSNAANAFATALICPDNGCGECSDCRTSLRGSHPDVELIRTEGLSIKVDEIRELIVRSAWAPSAGRHRVVVIEDADRLTETAANALLKAIEEPGSYTVWLLCAPSLGDLLPTIRSRCRHLQLRTPPTSAIAAMLVESDGIDEVMANHAARASQGHVGRARRIATDEQARRFRHQVLQLPLRLVDVASCMAAAAELIAASQEESAREIAPRDEAELVALQDAWGAGATGRGLATGASKAIKELEKDQKSRATALNRAFLDRSLLDLASFYRDVLLLQSRASVQLVNEDMEDEVVQLAERTTPEATIGRLDAIMAARRALNFSVAPLLALESMMLSIRVG
ncbi:DNA polymerase III subunit tau [mine drainage metagenome]|uniref:DNA polymerase III subunit delta' n=1 Tax=mine drainage metagenome TaxID=410659 RepID=A0A1J5Q063_9ZZZZ